MTSHGFVVYHRVSVKAGLEEARPRASRGPALRSAEASWCGPAGGRGGGSGAGAVSSRCGGSPGAPSLLLLGVVDGHIVVEDDEEEERDAQHVGEDGELHVRDHPAGEGETHTLASCRELRRDPTPSRTR